MGLLNFTQAILERVSTGERVQLAAHFSPKKIITESDEQHIDVGDVFLRTLPNGHMEAFEVLDASYHDAFGDQRYYCDVKRQTKDATTAQKKPTPSDSGAQRPKFQVFISSTYTDLKDVRSRVTWSILETQNIPAGMEAFPSTDDRGWKIIQRIIDQCDYYVLLLAGRYGSYDEAIGMSWTHREYRYARANGIPVLAFKRADCHIAKSDMEVDYEQQKRLADFIGEVGDNHKWTEWQTSDDLASKVNTSLLIRIAHDQDDGSPRPGWYRGAPPATTTSPANWETFPLTPSPEIRGAIQRGLQNCGTNLHAGRISRVISSWGTVGYLGLGADGKAMAFYHASGQHHGITFSVRLGIGHACRNNWVSLQGILGFPTSDEFGTPTGAQVNFEGGRTVWNASKKQVEIWSDIRDGGRIVTSYNYE